jgi:hypothetical protein
MLAATDEQVTVTNHPPVTTKHLAGYAPSWELQPAGGS